MARRVTEFLAMQTAPEPDAEGQTSSGALSLVSSPAPPFNTYCVKIPGGGLSTAYLVGQNVPGTDDLGFCVHVRFGGTWSPSGAMTWTFWQLEAVAGSAIVQLELKETVGGAIHLNIRDKNGAIALQFNNALSDANTKWLRIEGSFARDTNESIYVEVYKDHVLHDSQTSAATFDFSEGTGDVRQHLFGQPGSDPPVANPTDTYFYICALMAGCSGTGDLLGGCKILEVRAGNTGSDPDCDETGTPGGQTLTSGTYDDLSDDTGASYIQYTSIARADKGGAVKFDDGSAAGPSGVDLGDFELVAFKYVFWGEGSGTQAMAEVIYGRFSGSTYTVDTTIGGTHEYHRVYHQDLEDTPRYVPDADEFAVAGMWNKHSGSPVGQVTKMYECWGLGLLIPTVTERVVTVGKIIHKSKVVI